MNQKLLFFLLVAVMVFIAVSGSPSAETRAQGDGAAADSTVPVDVVGLEPAQ